MTEKLTEVLVLPARAARERYATGISLRLTVRCDGTHRVACMAFGSSRPEGDVDRRHRSPHAGFAVRSGCRASAWRDGHRRCDIRAKSQSVNGMVAAASTLPAMTSTK